MKLSPALVRDALAKAREARDCYELNYIEGRERVKYVDTLHDICLRYFGRAKSIKIHEHRILHLNAPYKGFYLSFNKEGNVEYEIVVMGGQNYCWKRLVICKELFHIILDEEKFENKSLRKLLDTATDRLNIGNENEPELFFQAELLSEIAAMEFLFPYSDREIIVKKAQEDDVVPDFGLVAVNYKIPTYFVKEYLSQQSMESLAPFKK